MSSCIPKIPSFQVSERAGISELQRQHRLFSADPMVFKLLDSVPNLLAILNWHRQIVFANQPLLELIGVADIAECLGQRPGEIFSCEHSIEMVSGCGASEVCSTCGAALALLETETGQSRVAECRMTRMRGDQLEALELEVRATPLQFKGEPFTVFALTDVSHQKWRDMMEKLFFHDVLNVVGTIKGFTEILQGYELRDKQEIYALIHQASEQVIEQVLAFRTLSAAEKRELQVNCQRLSAHNFLAEMADLYRHHDAARDRILELDLPSEDFLFSSDRVLLARIIGNMLLNAFEATSAGQPVRLSCARTTDEICVAVHNPGEIPRPVQLQIFQRTFSTKGPGRGLGTYSLRLLSSYLGGTVSFTSDADRGTIFSARFPLEAASTCPMSPRFGFSPAGRS